MGRQVNRLIAPVSNDKPVIRSESSTAHLIVLFWKSPRSRLTERESLTWDDLTEVDYISLAQGSGNRFLIDQALANRDVRPRSFCEVKHAPADGSGDQPDLGADITSRANIVARRAVAFRPADSDQEVTICCDTPHIWQFRAQARGLARFERRAWRRCSSGLHKPSEK
ncbi:hypothetical protein J3Q05_14440 [Pseudomonas sp. D1-2]|uniref:hypothetical protein n=1 Tax=Pseudomonas sp. D1-2 TaxID=2817386 RepID=UPI003DA809DA